MSAAIIDFLSADLHGDPLEECSDGAAGGARDRSQDILEHSWLGRSRRGGGRQRQETCSQGTATAHQGSAQAFPTPLQLDLDRTCRHAQPDGRFVPGQPFQIAQYQRLAVARREPVQFFVQCRQQLAAAHSVDRLHDFRNGRPRFTPGSSLSGHPGIA